MVPFTSFITWLLCFCFLGCIFVVILFFLCCISFSSILFSLRLLGAAFVCVPVLFFLIFAHLFLIIILPFVVRVCTLCPCVCVREWLCSACMSVWVCVPSFAHACVSAFVCARMCLRSDHYFFLLLLGLILFIAALPPTTMSIRSVTVDNTMIKDKKIS